MVKGGAIWRRRAPTNDRLLRREQVITHASRPEDLANINTSYPFFIGNVKLHQHICFNMFIYTDVYIEPHRNMQHINL